MTSTLIFANPDAIPEMGVPEVPLKGMYFFADRDFPLPIKWNLDTHLGPIVGTEKVGGVSFNVHLTDRPSKTIYWLSGDPPILATFGFENAQKHSTEHYTQLSYINVEQPWEGGVVSYMFYYPEKSAYFKGDTTRVARANGVVDVARDMLRLMDWADITESLHDKTNHDTRPAQPSLR